MTRVLPLAISAAAIVSWTAPAAAQAPAAAKAKPTTAAKWTAPKTPWGHPDLQGEWTSDSARGIPRERPAEFAGRAELTDAGARRSNQTGRADDQERRGGDGRADRRPGRILARLPDLPSDVADRRSAGRQDAAGHAGGAEAGGAPGSRQLRERSLRRPRGLHALRSMHHPRHRRRRDAGSVRQRQSDPADARRLHHHLRDDSRHARRAARRPSASRQEPASVPGRLARALGRQHAGRRNDELHRPDERRRRERQRAASQRGDEADRAIHAHRRRRAGCTRSPSTIRRPTHGRGPSSCRWSRRQASRRCPTSATRGMARSNTSCPPSAPRTRRSPRT